MPDQLQSSNGDARDARLRRSLRCPRHPVQSDLTFKPLHSSARPEWSDAINVRHRTDKGLALSYRGTMQVPNPAGDDAAEDGTAEAVGASGESGGARYALRADGTAQAVSDHTIAAWKSTAAALSPIIGSSSVSELYRRCLTSLGAAHAWLPSVSYAKTPESDWAALHASLSDRTPQEAAEVSAALFAAFDDLLASLIGPSLTAQLLHAVSALTQTCSTEQDNLP